MSEPDWSNLRGLIIGVNKYKSESHPDLQGCVSDANSFGDFLVERLGLPEENLVRLFDEEATRQGIINAFFKHLIYNEDIKPSDPVVIFFAGHGDSRQAPAEIHSIDGKWEFILPHDADTTEPDGSHVYGIPDRTLNALLFELSKEKGDNITVILDSCFSGSGTRGHARTRHSHCDEAPIPPASLDMDIIKGLPPTVPVQAPFDKKGERKALAPSLGTHVLLAACRGEARAQEIANMDPVTGELLDPPFSGLFTFALLKALRECNLASTNYVDLMQSVINHSNGFISTYKALMKLTSQIPQCEGLKKDRLLFRTQFATTKGMIALITRKGIFHIKAGSASGIQIGSEFAVYSGQVPNGTTPLALLVATEVGSIESTLGPREPGQVVEVPQNSYVIVTKYSDKAVRILVNERDRLPDAWDEVFENVCALPIEVILSKPGEASDLVLVPTDNGVILQRTDPSLIQLEPRDIKLNYDLRAEELSRRLSAIIHFHFRLQRRNPDSPLKGQINMQLIDITHRPLFDFGESVLAPTQDDLFGDSLATGAVATLQANPDKRYGLILTNRSNWPLFAYVLYFDLEDYSIGCLYGPPSKSMIAPLKNNGMELTIGYGSSGTDPLRVVRSGSSEKESGLFMLFVSSAWVDLSHVEQESPFEKGEDTMADFRKKVNNDAKATPAVWDSISVGVSIVD